METTQEYELTEGQTNGHPRLNLEYIIDFPPCSREERRRLIQSRKSPADGKSPAAHRDRRVRSSESATERPLSTDRAVADDVDRHPVEFHRRASPFRQPKRVKRPLSATPVMETDRTGSVFKARFMRDDADRKSGTGDATDGGTQRQICSLQQMVRVRRQRTSSNSSSNSNQSLSEDHHEQVRISSNRCRHHYCLNKFASFDNYLCKSYV